MKHQHVEERRGLGSVLVLVLQSAGGWEVPPPFSVSLAMGSRRLRGGAWNRQGLFFRVRVNLQHLVFGALNVTRYPGVPLLRSVSVAGRPRLGGAQPFSLFVAARAPSRGSPGHVAGPSDGGSGAPTLPGAALSPLDAIRVLSKLSSRHCHPSFLGHAFVSVGRLPLPDEPLW